MSLRLKMWMAVLGIQCLAIVAMTQAACRCRARRGLVGSQAMAVISHRTKR